MTEIYDVLLPGRAREILDAYAGEHQSGRVIEIRLDQAAGCVLAEDIKAKEPLPGFTRSTMDGFAVISSDTFGASDGIPSYLDFSGDILMGQHPEQTLLAGTCMRISTGGMLPPGADAVVMVEYTRQAGSMVEISRSVSPGENVLFADEDYAFGDSAIKKGTRIRPQEAALLAGLGYESVKVFDKLHIGILSTGDEIIQPSEMTGPGKIRDMNTYSLLAALTLEGHNAVSYGIIPDEKTALTSAVRQVLQACDVVIISGGSSVGARDTTMLAMEELSDNPPIFHGISVRPGKPTLFTEVEGKPVIGLPGPPVSALMIYKAFFSGFLYRIAGNATVRKELGLRARLSRNLPSTPGREDYIRVSLKNANDVTIAEPIFGKSGLISTLVAADGYIVIPEGVEGFLAGSEVDVKFFWE